MLTRKPSASAAAGAAYPAGKERAAAIAESFLRYPGRAGPGRVGSGRVASPRRAAKLTERQGALLTGSSSSCCQRRQPAARSPCAHTHTHTLTHTHTGTATPASAPQKPTCKIKGGGGGREGKKHPTPPVQTHAARVPIALLASSPPPPPENESLGGREGWRWGGEGRRVGERNAPSKSTSKFWGDRAARQECEL